MLAIFGLPGPMEMVILLVLILLLFGNRIPQVAKSLGKGITEFKKGVKSGVEDEDEELEEDNSKKKSSKKVKKEDNESEDEE